MNNRADRCYAGAPNVNGKPHTGAEIAHRTISEGGEIVFEMAASPQS
jgi:putative alpha-1,2-mannosidase